MPALLPQPAVLQPLASTAGPPPSPLLLLRSSDQPQYFQHHPFPTSPRDACCRRNLPLVSTVSFSSPASLSVLQPGVSLSPSPSPSPSAAPCSPSLPVASSPIYNAIVSDRIPSLSSPSPQSHQQHRHISPQQTAIAAAVGAPTAAYAHAPRHPPHGGGAPATSPQDEQSRQKEPPRALSAVMTKKSTPSNLSLSSAKREDEENMGARPRTATSESVPSPTKSRFSRLRYRRFREKGAPQNPPSSPSPLCSSPSLESLEEAGFLGVPRLRRDEDEEEDVVGRRMSFLRRPSTSGSTTSTSSSSSRWSWSMRRGVKGSRSSTSLRERWRASVASSSSALSSSSSLSSASSSSSGSSASTISSTWSSLESTPRASIASSRTSISSTEDIITPPPPTDEQKQRPQKRVRANVCRHFTTIPIEEEEEEEEEEEAAQETQPQQTTPPPCCPSTENHITDPIADAFDPGQHIPIALLPRPPFAEPTPPPTPPPTTISHPPDDACDPVPTFTLTPASPIRESPPTAFPPTPPITVNAPPPARPKILGRRSSFSGRNNNETNMGAPNYCPACIKLQESIQHMRKVAGIYGPRHSLTVAAAKVVRAARVAVAGVAWETSCALPASEGESGARSGGERARKVVRFKEGAEFWGDFCDRKKEEEEKVARTEEGSGGGGLLIGGNAEAMKSREMIITQRLWGPLGERGRKQRDFKRSASESYVPGRWAPPPPAAGGHEGWLDTSGRAMSYDEFWGGKEGHGAGVGKVRLMEGLLKRWVHAGVGIGSGAAAGVAAGKNKESEKERLEKEMLRESRGVPGAGLEVD